MLPGGPGGWAGTGRVGPGPRPWVLQQREGPRKPQVQSSHAVEGTLRPEVSRSRAQACGTQPCECTHCELRGNVFSSWGPGVSIWIVGTVAHPVTWAVKTSGKEGSALLQGQLLYHTWRVQRGNGQTRLLCSQMPGQEGRQTWKGPSECRF